MRQTLPRAVQRHRAAPAALLLQGSTWGTLAFRDLEIQAKALAELGWWDPGTASLTVKGRMPPGASAGGRGGGMDGGGIAEPFAGHTDAGIPLQRTTAGVGLA